MEPIKTCVECEIDNTWWNCDITSVFWSVTATIQYIAVC